MAGDAGTAAPPAGPRDGGSRVVIDGTFWLMFGVLAVLTAIAWGRGGSEFVAEGWGDGLRMLLRFSLVLVLAFLVAGLAEKLVPHEWVRSTLGEEAGLRGILIAVAAGAITPSGPFVSMPIAAAMLRSGAGSAAIVAFLSSWALLALHRFIAWEVPILGLRFALLRYAVCVVLPVLAGLIVRALGR